MNRLTVRIMDQGSPEPRPTRGQPCEKLGLAMDLRACYIQRPL